MIYWRKIAVGLLCVLLATGMAMAGKSTFLAGNKDNFDTSDGSEPASPSAELLNNSHGCVGQPPIDFDYVPVDRCFGHTFEDLPGGILEANLTIHMRVLPSSRICDPAIGCFPITFGQPFTDHFHLEMSKGQDRWDISMNDLIANATNGSQTRWTAGSDHTFKLDLDNLPPGGPENTTSVLSSMNENNTLDVWVDDETGVDYIELTVCTRPGAGKGQVKGKGPGQGNGGGPNFCRTESSGKLPNRELPIPGQVDVPR